MPSVAWDVVVVGAGPAGASAAREIAAAGWRTLLIERHPTLDRPVRCGELLRTSSLAAAVDPDGAWTVKRFSAYAICGPMGAAAVFEGEDFGRMIDRRLFDVHLVRLAEAAGAEILLGAELVGLKRHASFFELEIDGGRALKLSARYVIAADGVASRTARWLGLRSAGSLRGIAAAAFGTLTASGLDDMLPALRFGADIAPGGYAWMFPLGEGRANIGVGMEARAGGPGAMAALRAYAGQWRGAALDDMRAGALPITRPLPAAHVEGALVVGDAARHVNPLTGAGIGNAVRSGTLAGKVLADAAGRGDRSAQSLGKFDQLWRSENRDFHMRSLAIRRYLNGISDDDLDAAIRRLPARNAHLSVAQDLGMMTRGAA
ncbi:geranylgeranyl reductase family protein [Sphingomonas sp. DG1-23]|uniref:geranylgeranyl reductase family protein n=1 Tax=Sphingomonas sp. DG1-23 TaxID=3068316 RepID=UPI00273DF9A9|nr:geranylgeranyl reductase family protein [Sphingomonas sp. DG1-23]MDP5279854.1 geranylgeranyl reductase family protein [Sphingomonas sp. DG1-23]